jgi:hypothetical protein
MATALFQVDGHALKFKENVEMMHGPCSLAFRWRIRKKKNGDSSLAD